MSIGCKKGDKNMPPLSEARKRAKANYNAKVKRISVEFYPSEMDLYEKVKSQESIQKYIKELIRKDIQ